MRPYPRLLVLLNFTEYRFDLIAKFMHAMRVLTCVQARTGFHTGFFVGGGLCKGSIKPRVLVAKLPCKAHVNCGLFFNP